MKERPMLFNGEMVRAILDGSKTQTRRVLAPQPDDALDSWRPRRPVSEFYCVGRDVKTGRGEYLARDKDHQPVCAFMAGADSVTPHIFCPYGVLGDQLWVRETWCDTGINPAKRRSDAVLRYRADGKEGYTWKPSIHMPRWASRITLEITGVMVERLQEISGLDVVAEGVTYPVSPSKTHPGKCSVLWDISSECSPLNYIAEKDKGDHDKILIAHYAALWDSINGNGAWKANPWVWVIEFRRQA